MVELRLSMNNMFFAYLLNNMALYDKGMLSEASNVDKPKTVVRLKADNSNQKIIMLRLNDVKKINIVFILWRNLGKSPFMLYLCN